MKIIKTLFQQIINRDNKTLLGRWNIDYCVNRINQKVDLSNEDHCGACNQYIILKKEDFKNNWREIDEFYF